MKTKSKKSGSTPARKNSTSTPFKLTTSPYFSTIPQTSVRKRKHVDDPEDDIVACSTPNRLASVKHETRLTTSPYFSQTAAIPPRLTPVVESGDKVEDETRREKRRRKLLVRGETPEEPPPPPSSPSALSAALRRIKPELVQEKVSDNPWKIVVATTLLNKTTGKVALPVYWKLLDQWPTPIALAQAAAPSITQLLRPLGTQSLRTQRLMRLSNAYVMHPPQLPTSVMAEATSSQSTLERSPTPSPRPSSPDIPTARPLLVSAQSPKANIATKHPRQFSAKEYKSVQQASAIAHLPFAGPYAIDSFRIYSPSLSGGGAPSRVDEQLRRIACLPKVPKGQVERDDFDETPSWYDPELLRVNGDEDAEWRQVRPDDKELRRYLVWRWAIEGIAYNPEDGHTFEPASWLYLNYLIRK
ncbi:hypothetical protein FRC12_025004 [Ceratobasidium sp. 428]|nr:hypothetical protein FRC12_025004 [Ceratobasidium sp. 428]